MNNYLYYPGCSMESSARAYQISLTAIQPLLDLGLEEINDWNCCGATEYLSINLIPAYSLITRNLALATQQANGNDTIVAPCSACYLNLAKADHYMQERPILGEKVNEALSAGDLSYKPGSLNIRHLLDVIINDIGLDKVADKVTRPLKGLKVAPYLGCMVPRPDYEGRWSDHEYPNELDLLLEALGADVIDFPLKTHCCGGHMTQIGPETAFELIRRLIHGADKYDADIMITVCPMCQLNLDAYQNETNHFFHTNFNMPIMFFTQLMGLAFGIEPERLGIGLELVNANKALAKIGVEPVEEEAQKSQRGKKKPDTGLPMPTMPSNEEVSQ